MKKMKTGSAVKVDRRTKKADGTRLFKMKDADGRFVMEGDEVAILSDGIEMIDEDTFEDVTGVITKFESDCAVVNGGMFRRNEIRRIKG